MGRFRRRLQRDIAKPAWQHDAGCANRTANDIAAFADPKPGRRRLRQLSLALRGWRTYGGTSVSAPIVAGAIALAGNGKRVLQDAAHIYAPPRFIRSAAAATASLDLCAAGRLQRPRR